MTLPGFSFIKMGPCRWVCPRKEGHECSTVVRLSEKGRHKGSTVYPPSLYVPGLEVVHTIFLPQSVHDTTAMYHVKHHSHDHMLN